MANCSTSPTIAQPESRWMAAMRAGDFTAAWEETDRIERVRRQQERAGNFLWQPHHLLWNGEPFSAKRVLVRCNHGLGDTLQFIRYLPALEALAKELHLLVQPPLLNLLRRAHSLGNVHNGWNEAPPPPHELEIEIMELPYAFRSTTDCLPKTVPYLPTEFLPPHKSALPILNRNGQRRIGLVWAASEWDPRRSIPIQRLDPLRKIDSLQFYSFQQGAQATQWSDSRLPITSLSRHTQEIGQLAAVLMEMDLVLTVDCMVAHLAGALGRPVWLLLRHQADWRWLIDRTDSPWYPTMRLFRQVREGEWEPVVGALRSAFEHYVGQAPVSLT